MKKCYNCNKEHKNLNKIFCIPCEKKRKKGLEVKTSPTLIIYDKI